MGETFIQYLMTLPISDEYKEQIAEELKARKKMIDIFEFKYKRTVTDKTAITNILNASIKEVEKQKQIIEDTRDEINRTLTEMDQKNKLIKTKNEELNKLLTDLREAQEQLIMSEKMASLGQLTAGVAHEINNPINFVSANIKPLKEDLAELVDCIGRYDAVIEANNFEPYFESVKEFKNKAGIEYALQEIQDLLRGIEEGASRTSEIVKGLRNFSRLDQNVIKKADITEGIESTLTLLHNAYKDRIAIHKDFGAIPLVECLPGQINQVFMNILSNAIQAIPQKGEIFIKTWEGNNTVHISIRDTGSGMSESTKKKVFDPFFTTKEVGKGTGLGMSISYGIIKKHNGAIAVTSAAGEGTTFDITLPLAQTKDQVQTN